MIIFITSKNASNESKNNKYSVYFNLKWIKCNKFWYLQTSNYTFWDISCLKINHLIVAAIITAQFSTQQQVTVQSMTLLRSRVFPLLKTNPFLRINAGKLKYYNCKVLSFKPLWKPTWIIIAKICSYN